LTFLMDYPASRASLSRISAADSKVAERWELYRNGLELANAFGELTDGAEQRRRFEAANKFRAASNMHAYPEPVEFYAALDKGLPESSGCAIGVDRLLMLLCNAEDIRDVRA
jgi:lysyl-tRNA synthetase class 2